MLLLCRCLRRRYDITLRITRRADTPVAAMSFEAHTYELYYAIWLSHGGYAMLF